MKRSIAFRCAMFTAYAVPYSFLSAWGDAVHGTILFGVLMIAVLTMLCIISLKTRNAAVMFIGCGVTCITSLIAAKVCNLDNLNWYFKPFSAYSLIITYAIFQQMIQVFIYIIQKRKLP